MPPAQICHQRETLELAQAQPHHLIFIKTQSTKLNST